MSSYKTFINILNQIKSKAPIEYKKYHPSTEDSEKQNQALSRAYIHLFLKVRFGLLSFLEREHFITDGPDDGGIDGYFIDDDSKAIYLIQSKFRTNEENFENKRIKLEEILAMDTDRILDGDICYENGVEYNGKIKQLQREISSRDEIGRYRYQVIILANVDRKISKSKLRLLSGGLPVEIIDFERCYTDLLFPVVSGTYYNASDLQININLSDKNSGSNISYTVKTQFKECEITVLFIPTIEIAKILDQYKNSILKYNPRSYLEIQGKSVNSAIRDTIMNKRTNEFALFNNGITMLSDETFLNLKIGQKDKAQLLVKNPQIINGGQTAYTLGKVLAENPDKSEIFEGKEVLLKVITFLDDEIDSTKKRQLIREISKATNQQSVVTNADKKANDEIQVIIQRVLFKRLGIFYERKRGEFGDGVTQNYISEKDILERTLFTRLFLFAKGERSKATQTKRVFLTNEFTEEELNNEQYLERFKFAYNAYKNIVKEEATRPTRSKMKTILRKIQLISLISENFKTNGREFNASMIEVIGSWHQFILFAKKLDSNKEFKHLKQRKNGVKEVFKEAEYTKSPNLANDIDRYVKEKLSRKKSLMQYGLPDDEISTK